MSLIHKWSIEYLSLIILKAKHDATVTLGWQDNRCAICHGEIIQNSNMAASVLGGSNNFPLIILLHFACISKISLTVDFLKMRQRNLKWSIKGHLGPFAFYVQHWCFRTGTSLLVLMLSWCHQFCIIISLPNRSQKDGICGVFRCPP